MFDFLFWMRKSFERTKRESGEMGDSKAIRIRFGAERDIRRFAIDRSARVSPRRHGAACANEGKEKKAKG